MPPWPGGLSPTVHGGCTILGFRARIDGQQWLVNT
jgi:hypothetical protein